MSRSRRIVLVVVLVVALAIGGGTLWSLYSTDDADGNASSVEEVRDRTAAAQATVELADRPSIPRIAGLGLGLALGLAGGAGVAYVRRGGRS